MKTGSLVFSYLTMCERKEVTSHLQPKSAGYKIRAQSELVGNRMFHVPTHQAKG